MVQLGIDHFAAQVKANNAGSLSLGSLMPLFKQYGDALLPHQQMEEMSNRVEDICRQFGIWIEKNLQSVHYTTMTSYTFPEGDPERIIPPFVFLNLNYYLDDVYGNDIRVKMTEEEKKQADDVVAGLEQFLLTKKLRDGASPSERVLQWILMEVIRLGAPKSWLKEFFSQVKKHVEVAYDDRDASSVKSFDEYLEIRFLHGGMKVCMLETEFVVGFFSPVATFSEAFGLEMGAKLEEVHRLVCILATISNDIISLEKEVLDERTTFGAIQVLVLIEGKTFAEALKQMADLVETSVKHLEELMKELLTVVADSNHPDKDLMTTYLVAVDAWAKASWKWQIVTPRYKRKDSIFIELAN